MRLKRTEHIELRSDWTGMGIDVEEEGELVVEIDRPTNMSELNNREGYRNRVEKHERG